VGECFLWYRPTWAVPDKRQLNGCVCVRCLRGYLSFARRKWCTCGPADATTTSSCFTRIQTGWHVWCQLTQVVRGKEAIKQVLLCVLLKGSTSRDASEGGTLPKDKKKKRGFRFPSFSKKKEK